LFRFLIILQQPLVIHGSSIQPLTSIPELHKTALRMFAQ